MKEPDFRNGNRVFSFIKRLGGMRIISNDYRYSCCFPKHPLHPDAGG